MGKSSRMGLDDGCVFTILEPNLVGEKKWQNVFVLPFGSILALRPGADAPSFKLKRKDVWTGTTHSLLEGSRRKVAVDLGKLRFESTSGTR
jgi:hypothetical protein